MVPEGRAVKVPQGCEDGEAVAPNSRMADSVAEALPLGVNELRSGASDRLVDEYLYDGC